MVISFALCPLGAIEGIYREYSLYFHDVIVHGGLFSFIFPFFLLYYFYLFHLFYLQY